MIGTPEGFYDEEDPYYFPDAMADRTLEWLHGVRRKTLTSRSSSTSQRAAATRRTTCASLGRQVQGQVRPGMGQAREETFARQKELGWSLRTPS